MAELIVTRARESLGGLRRPFQILVDGRRAAWIGAGSMVEIPLPPGRHQVRARAGFLGGQPVEIDAGPEGVYHLNVGSNKAIWRRWRIGFIITILAPGAIQCIGVACSGLFPDPLERIWFGQFTIPAVMLPLAVQLALMVRWRDHFLAFQEPPTLDPAARRVLLPAEPPLRVRITTRGTMIAVAILALILGAAVEWARFTRRDFFRRKSDLHVQSEAMYRGFEQGWVRMAAEWDKKGANATSVRRSAARCAARAEYHSAMKRKYMQAAAGRWFSVEPDPPEPPWP